VKRDAVAIVARGATVTYAQLEQRVASAIGRLRTLGVGRATRVGLWAENSPEWMVIALAVARAGGVLVPLNTRLAGPEIEWQTTRAALPLVIASDALAARRVGAGESAAQRGAACRVVSLSEWKALAPGDCTPAPGHDDPDREAAIVFTSGTTGRPKAAVLTRGNELASARASAQVLPLDPGDRWLASLPFFHVGGMGIIQRCVLAGACVVLPDSFAAEDLERAITTEAVTHLSVVDATLRRILEARRGRELPERVRAAVVGGGPVSPALLDACPQALATYGLTESCSMVTLVRPGSPVAQRRTAGPPLPGIELRIAADGVIEVRGPVVMRGYLDDSMATQAALHDGWLRTGDLGEIDAQGCLRVLSRRDDLIISGGENVYPAEVEHALCAHPEVAEAVVIGVPDATWGEVPLAFVVLRNPGAPDLRAYLEARLARYKLPRITFVAEIPRLANGKPDRVALGTVLRNRPQ
jgi:O-succinylbenzoic acid--CoA ligase